MSFKVRKCDPKYYGKNTIDCENKIKGLDKLFLANLNESEEKNEN
jgi:hypothetical protein